MFSVTIFSLWTEACFFDGGSVTAYPPETRLDHVTSAYLPVMQLGRPARETRLDYVASVRSCDPLLYLVFALSCSLS